MNKLQLFNNPEFGEIRMIEVDGQPYAVGNDVAKALGYQRPNDAITAHCRGTVKRRITDSSGRQQLMNVIPEGDLYRLIVKAADQSVSEEVRQAAERFERWIFDEVLPAIRKTGKYENSEYKKMNAEARAKNAQVRKAREYLRLAEKYKDQSFAQILDSYATVELSGEHLIPLPEQRARTYSATEIGERMGISANMVGRLAIAHNLKVDEYGVWVNDKAKGHNKEVPNFRYYEKVVPVLEAILDQQSA